MSTFDLLRSTTIPKNGFAQLVEDATDLDGWNAMHITVNVNIPAGSAATLSPKIAHAPRNRDIDYISLVSWSDITASTTLTTYIKEFSRFAKSKVDVSGTPTGDLPTVEILVVPKKA